MRLILILLSLILSAGHQDRVAFVGDSITRGRDAEMGAEYASLASAALGKDEKRFVYYHLADTLVLWSEIEDYIPDTIVVELGTHAVVGCDHLSAQDAAAFRDLYARVLDRAIADTNDVYALSIPWLDWGDTASAKAQLYNEIIEVESQKRGIKFIDIWTPLEECGTECLSYEDGFHPNTKGHRLIYQALIDANPTYIWIPFLRG